MYLDNEKQGKTVNLGLKHYLPVSSVQLTEPVNLIKEIKAFSNALAFKYFFGFLDLKATLIGMVLLYFFIKHRCVMLEVE